MKNSKLFLYQKISLLLVFLIIFFTLFRGLLSNYFSFMSLVSDIVFFVCLAYILIVMVLKKKFFFSKENKVILFIYAIWFLLAFIVLLLQMLCKIEIYRDAILGFRNDIFYTIPFLLIMISFNENMCIKAYNYIKILGVFVCIFAIIQYVFRKYLPVELLTLKVDSVASFIGTDVIRVTALLGNSIIYSGFSVIMISIFYAEYLEKKKREYLILLIIAVISNLFSFSRASIVGMVMVMIFEYLLFSRNGKLSRTFIRILVALIIIIVLLILCFTVFKDTIIVRRLFISGSFSDKISNETHTQTILNAIDTIYDNVFLGLGFGKVGYACSLASREVIRDGTFWIYILEWGLPLNIIYWLMLYKIIKKTYISTRTIKKNMAIKYSFISMYLYFVVASFINSSYSARSVLVIVWIFTGIVCMIDNMKNE